MFKDFVHTLMKFDIFRTDFSGSTASLVHFAPATVDLIYHDRHVVIARDCAVVRCLIEFVCRAKQDMNLPISRWQKLRCLAVLQSGLSFVTNKSMQFLEIKYS